MRSCLAAFKNWGKLLAEAKYSIKVLAQNCGVCERQLRRFIWDKFGQTAQQWAFAVRMQRGHKLAEEKHPVNRIAEMLCYA